MPKPDQIMKAFLDPTGYDAQFEQHTMPEPGSTLPDGSLVLSPDEREELARIIDRDRFHMLNCEALMERKGHEVLANCMRQAAENSERWAKRLREGNDGTD